MSDIFDIAVIGAGPAGANAAITTAKTGLNIALIDEQNKAGGQVWRAKSEAILSAPPSPETCAGNALRTALDNANCVHFKGTRLWQVENHNDIWHLHVIQNNTSKLICAKTIILATGAYEFIQPVPGWTTPGTLGLAGVTSIMKSDLALPGKNTVVSGTGPLVFFVASEIRRLGGKVAAVITPNTFGDWVRLLPRMTSRADLLMRGFIWITDLYLAGIPIKWGHAVTSIHGDKLISSLSYHKLNKCWVPKGNMKTIEADSLCLGNGLLPSVEAAQLIGIALHHDLSLGGWVPQADTFGATPAPSVFVCGDSAGIRGVAAAELHGKIVGNTVATYLGKSTNINIRKLVKQYNNAVKFGSAITSLSMPRPGMMTMTTHETIVCRCEGRTRKHILEEIDTGAMSANAIKSGIRSGMGPCGGKYCQTVVNNLVAHALECNPSDIHLPTPRPPLRPMPVSILADGFNYSDLPLQKPSPL